MTTETIRADQALILEDDGADPADTTLTIVPGRPRTIVIRHPDPDNTVFATLEIPAGGLGDDDAPVALTLATRPGIYGLEVRTDAPFGPGVVLTFKYPVHFAPPAAAIARYGSRAAFERRLVIARRNADGTLALLASGRPAGDNLSALLNTPGTYVVAAPR
ncbi:MAG TPA: hypothetical protein VFU45_05510 [Gemmatimonadales bacterium]|nr:hypothetical protein [Gemmatimonadales bacterium]